MREAIASIVDSVNRPGLINVDFQDVRTVLSHKGMALIGTGSASGPERARIAAERAIAGTLLKSANVSSAKGLLVSITASRQSLKLRDTKEVMNVVRAFAADDADIIYSGVYEESLGDILTVTIVATGLASDLANDDRFQLGA
jgi:cell division protein FtsZ